MSSMPKQHPLAEVFGFPTDNMSDEAQRYRSQRLCPFNNVVPHCTKDKAESPLGVCSVFESEHRVITCPIRFRQDWLIVSDAAAFFFPSGTRYTSLTEVRLNDKLGKSAGNIDIVLVAFDEQGHITDFGALEVQAVYISGNIRKAFEHYMADQAGCASMDWSMMPNYPRPDYLSSSRKRLAPQLLYKGGILHAWHKKQAVAVDRRLFGTLPEMESVAPAEAEIAWLIYDLERDAAANRYRLRRANTVYTRFDTALERMTRAEPGNIESFVAVVQEKLRGKPEKSASSDTLALDDDLERRG